MFCEHLDYNLLFRWFLDMDVAEPSFDNFYLFAQRARLLETWRASFSPARVGPQSAVAFG
jgi:hypothetical protein